MRRRYRQVHHHRTQQRRPLGFLRRPIVQLSILGIVALVVVVIALTGGK